MKYLIQPEQASPGILFFLPLIYVAWSDSILTPTEIELIEEKIKEQDWLSQNEKESVCALLNPQNPPSVADLRQWKNPSARKIVEPFDSATPKHQSEQQFSEIRVISFLNGTKTDFVCNSFSLLSLIPKIRTILMMRS